jgi:hypothetical protein
MITNIASMKKFLIIGLLSFALVAGASIASAQTDVDPRGNASTCINLTHDLRVTSSDAETQGQVSDLQFFLQGQGYLASEPTGYFGLQTYAAVQKFQTKNNITPASGFVGPLTRTAINSAYCISLTDIPQTYDEDSPSIELAGKVGSLKSTESITVEVGKKFIISGKPQNLKGVDYGEDDDEFLASWNFGRLLDDQCSGNKIKSSNTWILTCEIDTVGSTVVYVEIYKDGNTYRSNQVEINVVSEAEEVDYNPNEDEDEDDEDEDNASSRTSAGARDYKPRIDLVTGRDTADFVIRAGDRAWVEGENLLYSGKDAQIRIGTKSALILQYNDDLVRFEVPDLPSGMYKFALKNSYDGDFVVVEVENEETEDSYDYTPVIYEVQAKAADPFDIYGGESIVINGKNLIYSGKDTRVFVGGKEADIELYTQNSIVFEAPYLSRGDHYLYLTTEFGTSNRVTVHVR